MTWHRPERFRRVCPLLVRTPHGLRCSADTEDVRPFWGITFRVYGGAFLAVYAAVVISVFAFLRSIGYPVSIVHVALPPLWHRVGQARGWFFSVRAQDAFAAGRTNEGMLYLANSFELDSSNYQAGLALAKAFQLGQPEQSDRLFQKLLETHPEYRAATSEQWFRALLARGDFDQIATLAAGELSHDSKYANVWIRALLFATQQSGNDKPLRALLSAGGPAAIWKPVIETELLFRKQQFKETRAALERAWPDTPPFMILYRVQALLALNEPIAALDLLVKRQTDIDAEAYLTYRLECLSRAGADQMLRTEFQIYLLDPALSQPRLKVMCAQLIRHPDRELFRRLMEKVAREKMSLTDETAGGWFSLLCTAGAVGDTEQLRVLAFQLTHASEKPFTAPAMVESFFRDKSRSKRATTFLPLLPMPLEIAYALIERYPGRNIEFAAGTP